MQCGGEHRTLIRMALGFAEDPWEWFARALELRAPSLYRTLGLLDPIFVDGEWLAPASSPELRLLAPAAPERPTLCLEPAAAALERAIVAPESVRRRGGGTDIASMTPPTGGWPRGVTHIGPIEELLLRTEVWSKSLSDFISETTATAALALEEVASRYAPTPEAQ